MESPLRPARRPCRSTQSLEPRNLRKVAGVPPEDNPVRVIDVFVEELDLRGLGFEEGAAEVRGPWAHRVQAKGRLPPASHVRSRRPDASRRS
jgi:hypothetical protein